MANILIIDDEESLRKLMVRILELEGYTIFQAANLRDGMKVLLREPIHVVISDVKLPDGNGVEGCGRIKADYPSVEVIVLTAYGTIADGVEAMKRGAFDYLIKGDHQERLLPLVRKAADKSTLQYKVTRLEQSLRAQFGFEAILGQSPALKAVVDVARQVAPTDATVLLLGETGTGKEVFARAIHHDSTRRTRPFVALNCSAFAKDLLESELFGHAEGAFTGAVKSKRGYIEEAHEGTLFLDEIGELNIDLQAKLLRLLESGEYYRVGDPKVRRAQVRFIAATHRDLKQEVAAQRFREDLYYRLSMFTLSLPALRERQADVVLLAQHFAREAALKNNKPQPVLSDSLLQTLQRYRWPGNIRELKNIIDRCVILATGELTPHLLPSDFDTTNEGSLDLVTLEKQHIRKVLLLMGGNKTQAAKALGIGLTTLYQKIKDYEL